MSNQPDQTSNSRTRRREIKSLHRAVKTVGLPLSRRHNARYGTSDAVNMLVTMCDGGISAEEAAQKLNARRTAAPSADWLLGLAGRIDYADMHKSADAALRQNVRAAIAGGMISELPTVAIDKTIIARYDKNPNMSHLIKYPGRGTNTGEAYMTAKIVGQDECNMHVAAVPVTRDGFNPDFVRKLLNVMRMIRTRPGLILADREFYATTLMLTLARAGLNFLIPAVRTSRIKNAIDEHLRGERGAVSEHSVKSGYDQTTFRYRLVIVKKTGVGRNGYVDDHRGYVAFATNLPGTDEEILESLPSEYRKVGNRDRVQGHKADASDDEQRKPGHQATHVLRRAHRVQHMDRGKGRPVQPHAVHHAD